MRYFLLLFILIILKSGFADVDNPTKGINAFKENNFQEAIQYFNLALKEGNKNKGLLFNLGVSYYKVGELKKSQKVLQPLSDDYPEDDAILYTLAVVEKKLGNTTLALQYFEEISENPDAEFELVFAAEEQIDILLGFSSKKKILKKNPSRWFNSLDFSLGHDDQVINIVNDIATEDSDTFTELSFTTHWQSRAIKNNAWHFTGLYFQSNYDTVDEYDLDLYLIELNKRFVISSGYWLTGLSYETTNLNGTAYLNTIKINFSWLTQLSDKRHWLLKTNHRTISSQNANFDQFEGSSYQLDLSWNQREPKTTSWSIGYRFTQEDRDDLENGNAFTSYSPTRHAIYLRNIVFFSPSWQFSTYINYQTSRYADEHRFTDTNDVIIRVERRKDDRLNLRLRLSWSQKQWMIYSEFNSTDNQSSIDDIYGFDRNSFNIGASFSF